MIKRVVSINVLGMLVIKAVSMIIGMAILPMYISYFDGDDVNVGRWLVIFTSLTILISFDLGVNNRIKNDLLSNRSNWPAVIIRGMQVNIIVSFLLVLAGFLAIFLFKPDYTENVSWYDLFYLSLFLIIIAPFKISIAVLQALQHNWVSALVVILPQTSMLLFLYFFGNEFIGNKHSVLFYVYLISNIIFYFFCFIYSIRGTGLKFMIILTSRPDFYSYIRASFPFFVTQLTLILLIAANDVIYGLLGKENLILEYNYFFRVYALIFVAFSSVTMPFWSAIRYQHLNGNTKSALSLSRWLFLLLIPMLFFTFFLGLNIQKVFDFWIGSSVYRVDYKMVFYFSVLSLSMCIMYASSAFLNAYDEIRFQARVMVLASLIKFIAIFFSLFFAFDSFDMVLMSTVLCMSFIAFIFLLKVYFLAKQLRSSNV